MLDFPGSQLSGAFSLKVSGEADFVMDRKRTSHQMRLHFSVFAFSILCDMQATNVQLSKPWTAIVRDL